MPHKDIPLTPRRWEYLKSLRVVPRMVHVSAEIIRHPITGMAQAARGVTYNIGRNAAKREKRAMRTEWTNIAH